MPSLSNFSLISTTKNPPLITLSNRYNSVEFLKDLTNNIMSLSVIGLVEISNSSTENSLKINEFNDGFLI